VFLPTAPTRANSPAGSMLTPQGTFTYVAPKSESGHHSRSHSFPSPQSQTL